MSSQPSRVPVASQALEDLPGSVPEQKEERPCPVIHNPQFNSTAGQSSVLFLHTH